MLSEFDPGARLGATYILAGGLQVRLRLARASDAAAIRALLDGQGVQLDGLAFARLAGFDPRHRQVICATALIGRRERIVGIGAVELDRHAPEPDTVIVDEELAGGARQLLVGALVSRAQAWSRTRAA